MGTRSEQRFAGHAVGRRSDRRQAFVLPKLRGHFDAFSLIELLVVISIIAVLLAVVMPSLPSLSRSNSCKAAVSNLMNALEQARSLALTSRSATYVVFADQTTPDNYRSKAFIIFQDDKNFAPVAVTKWYFLPTGISFRVNKGLLTAPSGSSPLKFSCPGTMGSALIALPYIKFDSNGMVAAPTDPSLGLFVDLFSGSVDAGGQMNYTDQTQRTNQKFDAVVVARFSGRVRYVDPYS